ANLKAKAAGVSNADTEPLKARIRELETENDNSQRGIKFTHEQYRLLRACFHPDDSMSKERRTEAFKLFTDRLPEAIFREPRRGSDWAPMPKTADDLMRHRQAATAERKAKRAAAKAAKRRPQSGPAKLAR